MSERSSPAGPPRPRHRLALPRTLGFVAAGLAFFTSVGVVLVGGVYIGLACQGCNSPDGDWLVNGVALCFVVAVVGSVGVAMAGDRARVLAGIEAASAAGMVVAIVFVALDGADMHLDDSRVGAGFLYWVFALIAILFGFGAVSALVEPSAASVGSPEPLSDDPLGEARGLIAQGSLRGGLIALREAHRIAVAQGYADRLPEIAELAQLISTRTTGRLHRQSDRLARQAATPL